DLEDRLNREERTEERRAARDAAGAFEIFEHVGRREQMHLAGETPREPHGVIERTPIAARSRACGRDQRDRSSERAGVDDLDARVADLLRGRLDDDRIPAAHKRRTSPAAMRSSPTISAPSSAMSRAIPRAAGRPS